MITRIESVIQELGRIYGLDIYCVEPINKGQVNHNSEITTSDGKFFLREYGEKIARNEKDLIFEHKVLAHLIGSGFPKLARPIPMKNLGTWTAHYPYRTLVSLERRYFALFDFIEGRDADHCDLMEAARTLAYFHKAIESFEDSYLPFVMDTLWERQPMFDDEYDILLTGNRKEDYFHETLARLLPQVKDYSAGFSTNLRRFNHNLKKLVCHNDYHLGNIRIKANEAYITDFEGVRLNYRIYELAFATIAFCTKEDPGDLTKEKEFWEKARTFMNNYTAINRLHSQEIELMPNMIIATYVKLLPSIIKHHYKNTYETDERIRDETLTTIVNSFNWCRDNYRQMIDDLKSTCLHTIW